MVAGLKHASNCRRTCQTRLIQFESRLHCLLSSKNLVIFMLDCERLKVMEIIGHVDKLLDFEHSAKSADSIDR